MDLELSEDQVALVGELRRFLAARVETPTLATPELWDELEAMGVLTLPVPEAAGGVGLGWAEAALAFQELGRSGLAGPFVSTAAATAVGLAEGVTGLIPDGVPVVVEHLDRLDSLLVLSADGVHRVPVPSGRPVERPLDPLTPVHVVDHLPPGDLVGDSTIGRHAALLAAAQQVGLGYAALDRATTYAGERHQFGRPIGSFQAVKHLLADAVVGLEVARAAVDAAAVTADEDGDVDRAVTSARIVASEAAATAARNSIQVHGGMGYTWELPVHLYLKRILVLDQVVGSADDAVGP
ncbi:MAG TPA: acyl-CoA dehydrogenase family protein [Acidimicrobiales bacterium]|nr:acyl-CoA dehydrogenase family protein [Acidimicrobiales bacterium]